MRWLLKFISTLLSFVIELMVRSYQIVISPLLIGTCKFRPTCSEYMIQAVKEWGPIRGGWMGIRRLLRCHPFGAGGIDPVPKRHREGSNQ